MRKTWLIFICTLFLGLTETANSDDMENKLSSDTNPDGGFLITNAENETLLRILTNGNVGIGTSTPEYGLDVAGVTAADGFWLDGEEITHWTGTGLILEDHGPTGGKALAVDSSLGKFYFFSDGDTAAAPDPGDPIDVLTFKGTSGITVEVDEGSDTVIISGPPIIDTDDQWLFSDVTDGANTADADSTQDTLTLTGSGGITVTVSDDPETVNIDGSANLQNLQEVYDYQHAIGNDVKMEYAPFGGGDIRFHTEVPASYEILFLQQLQGNVGIGTSEPQYKLDVVGSVNADEFTLNGETVSDWTGMGISIVGGALTAAGSTSQDLFVTVTGDTGSTTADSPTDTITIVGTSGVRTSVSGDTLTIAGTGIIDTDDQFLFQTVAGDSGSTEADSPTDTITIEGGSGTGISTSVSGDALTIDFNASAAGLNIFSIVSDGGTSAVADNPTDTLTISGTNGIAVTAENDPEVITIGGAGITETLSFYTDGNYGNVSTLVVQGGIIVGRTLEP